MEFWGAEVKVGQPLSVNPGEGRLLHLSQACLGESKSKGGEHVFLYVKIGNQKLVLGTLSSEKFPQVSFDLVFDKEFELSHNLKNGSVYFTGYTSPHPEEEEPSYTDSEEELPLAAIDNGKPEPEPQPKKDAKPDTSGTKKKVQIVEPNKGGSSSIIGSKKNEDSSDEDDDEDEESMDDENANVGEEDDSDDDENEFSGVDSEDSDDEDSDDSLEEEDQTPKKVESSKKRPLEPANKMPAPDKKAKLVTPQKTDGKKGVVHVATPHPSKKHAAKTPAANDQTKQQTPKSAVGAFPCKSCTRAFGSETALQSHSKAKHSAAEK